MLDNERKDTNMKTEFVPTNDYYHRIINAPDAETRHQLYMELIVKPWKQMHDIMIAHIPDAEKDELSGARNWQWLLPDDLTEIPQSLAILEQANAWEIGAEAMRQGADCFAPYADKIGIDHITGWLMLADPSKADPIMRGYTGGIDFFSPRFAGQFATPDADNLPRLGGLIVHEMHHLFRGRLFPWGPQTTVADYIVMEGTAEAFAASLFGEDKVTFFVSEVDPADLEKARPLMKDGLKKSGFDVIRGYIFGDYWAEKSGLPAVGGMPAYAGYSTGYHVVKAFMERTGKSIVETTFIPSDEIVADSGYFD